MHLEEDFLYSLTAYYNAIQGFNNVSKAFRDANKVSHNPSKTSNNTKKTYNNVYKASHVMIQALLFWSQVFKSFSDVLPISTWCRTTVSGQIDDGGNGVNRNFLLN